MSVIPNRRFVALRARLLVYLATWFAGVIAFQIFLQPEGPTTTDDTELVQRLLWVVYSPVMATLGLAQAVTWPKSPGATPMLSAAASFAAHALLTLSLSRRNAFLLLTCMQVVLLGLGVTYYVLQSQLPTGG